MTEPVKRKKIRGISESKQAEGDEPSNAKPTDWSFLVVGKNFDPNRVDFSKWDTYEVVETLDD
jgi:hypothetical protein